MEWKGLAATSQSLSPISSMHIPRYANRMDGNPSRIQDVRWTEEVSLLSNLIQRAQVIRPGDTEENYVHKKNESNSTLATFEHMMHRQTNIWCSFKNGNTVEWELEQVCKIWGKGKKRQQWSQVDQEALGCLVLQVYGHVVSSTSHTLCTPFPTLLSFSVWTDIQTWYSCSVRWSLLSDIQNMLSMGKAQDAKIAEKPQEMGTDGHCTVRLRTWARNISPPATSLPPYSSSKHETNCAQQRGKSKPKIRYTTSTQRHDMLSGTSLS